MNKYLVVLLFSVCTLFGQGAMRFQNGDVLHGELKKIAPGEIITWSRPDIEGAIDFKATNVTDIVFPARMKAPQPTNHCIVRLTNDDEFEGSLIYADAENLQIETYFAGAVTVPRKMVRLLLPIPPEQPPVFEGPSSDEGWTHGKVTAVNTDAGTWEYRNGAFYATKAASIARDVKLPDVANLEFDLSWSGLFDLAVALYTDYLHPIALLTKDNEPNFSGFYSLQLNTFSANLLPVKKGEPLRYLGQAAILSFNQKNRAKISIRVNKPRKSITLLVDGLVVKQWIETEDFAGGGTGIRFVHQGRGSLRLSNIRITEWNGLFEDKSPLRQSSTDDLAVLRNGDKVGGSLKDARDGKFTFATSGSELVIPHIRVKQIEFATARLAKAAPPSTNAVRAFLNRNSWVTFRLNGFDGMAFSGSSENFGNLNFKPDSFERLQFNPFNTSTNN